MAVGATPISSWETLLLSNPQLAWGTCSYKCPDGYHYEGIQDIGRFCKICPPTCVTCLGALVDSWFLFKQSFCYFLFCFCFYAFSCACLTRSKNLITRVFVHSFYTEIDCLVLCYIVAGRSIWGQGQCTLCQNYTYLTPDQTCRALSGFDGAMISSSKPKTVLKIMQWCSTLLDRS